MIVRLDPHRPDHELPSEDYCESDNAGEYSPAFPSCTTAGACSAAEEYSPACISFTTAGACFAAEAEAAAGRLRARLPQPGAEEGCPQAERVGGGLKAMALHKG